MSKKGFALLFLPSLILTSCSFITPEPENEIPVEEEKEEEEKPQEEPPVEEEPAVNVEEAIEPAVEE